LLLRTKAAPSVRSQRSGPDGAHFSRCPKVIEEDKIGNKKAELLHKTSVMVGSNPLSAGLNIEHLGLTLRSPEKEAGHQRVI